mmetsp:Transcript_18542/g.34788  ORF Transcript_18542/g.34788 Transcript_18542/m.34788 type:complete len:317 (+) Transcript_18542:107-1057(+)
MVELQVLIRNVAGEEVCCVSASATGQIWQIKHELEKKLEIPALEQSLLSPEHPSPLRNSMELGSLLREAPSLELLLVRLEPAWARTIARILAGVIGFADVPKELQQCPHFIRTVVENNGLLLQALPLSFRSDEDIVVAAVRQNPAALSFASCSRGLVLAAVKCRGSALQYVSKKHRDDPDVVLAAVKQEAEALRFAGSSRLQDKEVVMAAVSQSGRCLQLAALHLRNDKEVVLAALANEPLALAHASSALQDNPDVVLAAALKEPRALKFASLRLRADREFLRKAAAYHKLAMRYALPESSDRGRRPQVRASGRSK